MMRIDVGSSLRLGSRASPLARVQTSQVAALIHRQRPGWSVTQDYFTTSGDKLKDKPLVDFGGKGLFTKEVDDALLSHTIDVAVHCAKDMPVAQHPGLMVGVVLPAADPRDVLITRHNQSLPHLGPGSVVGTASLRRQAFVRRQRPDLVVRLLRGNVQTRLKKLEEGYDAVVLAMAGLERLGMVHVITDILDPKVWVPACGQGIMCLQFREADTDLRDALMFLHCPVTAHRLAIERCALGALGGSCHLPVGVYFQAEGDDTPDGTSAHGTQGQAGEGHARATGGHLYAMYGDPVSLDYETASLRLEATGQYGLFDHQAVRTFAQTLKEKFHHKGGA